MTETPSSTSDAPSASRARKRATGLGGMLLADLKAMAGALGVAGTGSMKKAQLVDAIRAVQSSHASQSDKSGESEESEKARTPPKTEEPATAEVSGTRGAEESVGTERPIVVTTTRRGSTRQSARQRAEAGSAEARAAEARPAGASAAGASAAGAGAAESDEAQPAAAEETSQRDATDGQPDADRGAESGRTRRERQGNQRAQGSPDRTSPDRTGHADGATTGSDTSLKAGQDRGAGRTQGNQTTAGNSGNSGNQGKNSQGRAGGQPSQNQPGQNPSGQHLPGQPAGQGNAPQDDQRNQGNQGDDDLDPDGDGEGGSRRNRRRRGRDRTRTTPGAATGGSGNTGNLGSGRNEPDTTVLDDDVLVPAAGILDVLDNYAFVRTSGYLPGVDDVYLSLSMVRKFGLRRGDAVVGQVRQPREGERKEKFNPMVRIDTVNGSDPETTRTRPEFAEMTPVHPQERLRLETGPADLVGRSIDLAAPIGKGQRALVVSPSHAGKTTLLRSVADSVTRNNPECHLMVVLVDERPEEVTDFQRSVKGEVVASTFDRPPADHTIVAELAIERAKRLVELGHDVVVLLDGLTRLGRAYNLAAPAGGRALAAGMDASALYPPKRFFGAARNLEDGGSLTIIATATVDSGSPLDEVILDELADTANAEVRLRRDISDGGVFPCVDLARSGTRAVGHLVGDQERDILDKLRRVLGGLDDAAAARLVAERLRSSHTNLELLGRVQQAAHGAI